MILGTSGIAIKALEPILWEFEATPDTIIFRLVGASEHQQFYLKIAKKVRYHFHYSLPRLSN